MNKRTTLNLIEQSERVSIYSISFSIDNKTEFERFMDKFENIEEHELKNVNKRTFEI